MLIAPEKSRIQPHSCSSQNTFKFDTMTTHTTGLSRINRRWHTCWKHNAQLIGTVSLRVAHALKAQRLLCITTVSVDQQVDSIQPTLQYTQAATASRQHCNTHRPPQHPANTAIHAGPTASRQDRKSTRLNSSHSAKSRMPSSA